MSITMVSSTAIPPIQKCARLLRELHALISAGQGDSEAADLIRDEMDPLWDAMTKQERSRIRGLSEDLNTLNAGGAKQVEMRAEETERWQHEATGAYAKLIAGDPEAALVFLRRPFPNQVPRHVIPFLQARAWEALGDLETALTFMKEAERLDPDRATSVLTYMQQFLAGVANVERLNMVGS